MKTQSINCERCKETFKDIVVLKRSQATTFEQFKSEIARRYEDFMVGYQEQPTEQDLKDLYKDFLESGKTFDEYSKEDC